MERSRKVNLAEKFALLDGPYRPGTIGHFNGHQLQVVHMDGPFVWHRHVDTDDFFLVVEGEVTIHLREGDVELGPGDLFVVPAGVEHCPEARDARVLLIERQATVNTGDAAGELTAPIREI